jgi:transposase
MLLSLSHQGFSSYTIQEFTGINCRTIQIFLKRTRERGSIENNPRSGGRKKTIPKDERVIFRSVKRNRRQTLKDLTARFNNRTDTMCLKELFAGDCALVVTNDA